MSPLCLRIEMPRVDLCVHAYLRAGMCVCECERVRERDSLNEGGGLLTPAGGWICVSGDRWRRVRMSGVFVHLSEGRCDGCVQAELEGG